MVRMGTFEFGSNALDFIAPENLYKKEVLEYLGRFLKKTNLLFLFKSLLELR